MYIVQPIIPLPPLSTLAPSSLPSVPSVRFPASSSTSRSSRPRTLSSSATAWRRRAPIGAFRSRRPGDLFRCPPHFLCHPPPTVRRASESQSNESNATRCARRSKLENWKRFPVARRPMTAIDTPGTEIISSHLSEKR